MICHHFKGNYRMYKFKLTKLTWVLTIYCLSEAKSIFEEINFKHFDFESIKDDFFFQISYNSTNVFESNTQIKICSDQLL